MFELPVSHWIETATGWSIRKFVRTTRRYRTITIQAGQHTTITAADPSPTTSGKHRPRSTVPAGVRTSLIKVVSAQTGPRSAVPLACH